MNSKAYSGRTSIKRVPSQIFNPASNLSRESSGVNQRIDESYEATQAKYKIEYKPAKNIANTRKQSKVNTLVNSLMSSSHNTTGGILHGSTGTNGWTKPQNLT